MAKVSKNTTTKAIFERDGRILFVKDPKGVWELPGGRINSGETPEKALRRELEEELGWSKVDIQNIIDKWTFTSHVEGVDYKFLVMTYFCDTEEQDIKENDEYTEYKWIPVSEIQELNMRDGYKESIKKFLENKA